jgi:hypothetical protein
LEKVISQVPANTVLGDKMFPFRMKRAETPQKTPTSAYAQPKGTKGRTYFIIGGLCGVISLFILPEIFGTASAVLGAYVWRLDWAEPNNRGVWVVILGVVFMLVGIYYTSLFGLYNILP